jgi:hypothetical protein
MAISETITIFFFIITIIAAILAMLDGRLFHHGQASGCPL